MHKKLHLEGKLSYLSLLDEASKIHINEFSQQLKNYIKQSNNFFISFDDWMDKVLYAPKFGYYNSKDSIIYKNNDQYNLSDYITAPEIDSIFAETLSIQIEQVLQECKTFNILEIGAGNGSLAYDIIKSFHSKNIVVKYYILDISNLLIEKQKETLNSFLSQVEWLTEIPNNFIGCVVANELLDAMPISMFKLSNNQQIMQMGVTLNNKDDFIWAEEKISIDLSNKIQQKLPLFNQYIYEINFRAERWIQNIIKWLKKGVVILIDYGFPRKEYYHPERINGTLMCHIKHYAHTNPLIAPGKQDITAHIDFTSIAENAINNNLQVLGYTSQANFLINAGIINILSKLDRHDNKLYLQKTNSVKKLLSETDMGEIFKVIAIGKDIDLNLIGFTNGNRINSLF